MKKLPLLLIAIFCLGIETGRAQYKVLINFAQWDNPQGSYPTGNLIASGGKLYGLTYAGGAGNTGVIFSIDTNGSNYKDLHNLDTLGGWTNGSLLLVGSKLYGTAYTGGAYEWGYIYTIDTNGSGFRDLFDFSDTGTVGGLPEGYLAYSNGRLYGTTFGGGDTNTMQSIFSVDTSGSSYKLLYGTDSYLSYSVNLGDEGLTLVGNKLYGTSGRGAHNGGFIFSIDTNGLGIMDVYDFDSATGENPNGQLLYGSGMLYGMTDGGGTGHGVIFSVDTNGAGYTDLFNFNGTNGNYPLGALAFSITGDTLFGTTISGGKYQGGTLFAINKNGSGYADMHDFSGGPTGFSPAAAVTLSGNILYGTASEGGLSEYGVVFSCKLGVCTNTFDEPICIATLDTSTNKNIVIWGRTNSPPDAAYNSYNIYKDTGSHGDTNAGYMLLNTQPLNSLSEYVDTTSNITGPVTYQISTVDSCGESALSAPHTTIYLTITAGINACTLNWTAYVGFTPTEYRIFRGPSLNALVQIDSVVNNIYTYTDSFPPLGSYYAIEAVSPNGVCTPTTHGPEKLSSPLLSGSFSNGFNTAALGVQNITATVSKLNIYPNPGNGMITLNYMLNDEGNVRTTVINELGQVVYDNTAQKSAGNITEQLNLVGLSSGIYSLRMQTDNSIMVRKVVIIGNR